MLDESPMDEVTDLIASIEMHRKEIEKEAGLEASRNYSLRRLQQALQEEQEAAQLHGSSPARLATAEALANEIKRVGSLARAASGSPRSTQANSAAMTGWNSSPTEENAAGRCASA